MFDDIIKILRKYISNSEEKDFLKEYKIKLFERGLGCMELYKYRDIDISEKTKLRDILKNNRLWLASLKSLNDPFDAFIKYQAVSSRVKDFEKTKKEMEDYESGRRNEIIIEVGENYDVRENINNIGICSLAGNVDNQLLWSHYCEGHRGVIVKIEIQDDAFEKMKYMKNDIFWEKYNKFQDGLFNGREEEWIEILTMKLEEWRYEEEYRIVKFQEANKYFPVKVKELILGIIYIENAQEKLEELIECIKICEENEIPVKVMKMSGAGELEVAETSLDSIRSTINCKLQK